MKACDETRSLEKKQPRLQTNLTLAELYCRTKCIGLMRAQTQSTATYNIASQIGRIWRCQLSVVGGLHPFQQPPFPLFCLLSRDHDADLRVDLETPFINIISPVSHLISASVASKDRPDRRPTFHLPLAKLKYCKQRGQLPP